MVVLNNTLQCVFESVPRNTVFTLPEYKEKLLEISYESATTKIERVYNGSEPVLPFANSEVFNATISSWRRLTAEHEDCKAAYEICFDVKGSNFNFQAGDTIGIIPKNVASEVEAVVTHLGLVSQADLPYTLASQKSTKLPGHLPVKSTLRNVLTHCVDLRCILKKLFLLALSKYTKDEAERKVLEYLCSKEGATIYQEQILNKNLCLLDIFAIFKSCKPPVQILLMNLPRLLPRPYSIVNSGQNTNIIKICFSVMTLENKRKGLTTGWLENLIGHGDLEYRILNLNLNDCDRKVPIYLRKNMSGFCLPKNLGEPIILIGPGTGVAPYLGFLEEIEEKKQNLNLKIGDIWLYFGCRNPKLDFIYEEELKGFSSRNVLSKLFTAFSRIDNGGIKYVQDAIKQNSKEMVNKIDTGARIFVCGDVKNMAMQIKDTLIQCLVENDRNRDEAEKLIAEMVKNKKYIVDAWS